MKPQRTTRRKFLSNTGVATGLAAAGLFAQRAGGKGPAFSCVPRQLSGANQAKLGMA